jgi:hypothetical protein
VLQDDGLLRIYILTTHITNLFSFYKSREFMKKFIFGIVILLSSTLALAQRNCASHEHLQQMILENPEMAKTVEYIERHTQDFITKPQHGKERAIITIPVVFHIVWRTNFAAENVSDAQIQSQLTVMNNDFRKLNADISKTPALFATLAADCEIQFCMAQRDPNGVASTGIVRYQSTRTTDWGTGDAVKKPASGGYAPWDASKYLNIWVCSIGGSILGYAQFPGGAAATDGVVIDYRYFGTIGTVSTPFNLGRTATHEIGHWLNLAHIWGDATCGTDNVTDTPTHTTSNGGCPAYPKTNTCNATTNTEMTMNYMDYSDDACMYMFSAGQKARMQALFAAGGIRVSLLTSNGCTPGGTTTCGTPTTLAAASITTSGATVSWAAVTGATSYNVQYKLSSATTWTTLASSTTSLALSGLTASTAYNYQVSAVCSGVNGSYSVASTFTTSAAATCGTPTTLAAASITTSGATVSWAAVTGATSYNVQYKLSSATTWTTLASSTTSLALSGLTASTAYNYQVSAVCSGVSGSYSAASTFTTSAAATCGVPTSLVVSPLLSTSATISWGAVTGAVTYTLQYKKSSSTTWTSFTGLTSTNKALTGLTAGTVYNYQVATVCAAATSAYTASASFTTRATCTDAYENNNTLATAKTLTPSTIQALISSTTDQDWFKVVTTAAAKNIRATISNLPANYDIALYTAAGTLLSSSLNAGTTNDVVRYNAGTTGATYYVKVYTTSGMASLSDCYTLLIETSASNLREATAPMQDNTSEINFNLYPNPANDEIILNFFTENSFRTDVTIHDMTGRLVATQEAFISVNSNKLLLDTTSLESGLYIVTARNSNMQKSTKLLIQR